MKYLYGYLDFYTETLFAMKLKNKIISFAFKLIPLFYFLVLYSKSIQAQDVTITITLRGVYESKISLIPLVGKSALKPIIVLEGVTKSEPSFILVPDSLLPGEFVLRFDYKEYSFSTPYPSEKRILIGNQDLEMWVHPIYSNNPDSTWFQKDERENTAYSRFINENAKQKEQLGLLQNFLLNYDNNQSKLYKAALKEYNARRNTFNNWVDTRCKEDKNLFASTLYRFQHVPEISWGGSEADRKKSLRDNYFNGMDFKDTMLLKTSTFKEWMDGYVNLYGELATSVFLRDSLFTVAGKKAIEKSKKGDPLVYGWMVDYFFNGYESFNIVTGMQMLQTYLDDPACLTSKRMEINRRLKGMKTLKPGSAAPDFELPDSSGLMFRLYDYKTEKKSLLLLFWSADCIHCVAAVEELYPWYEKPEIKKIIDVIAVSIDETEPEVMAWENAVSYLKNWKHLRVANGIRSKVAVDYFILSTPVMVLLDAETKKIIDIPETVDQLKRDL
jgi:thioredoxin-related protein